jgi:hypothetical protein
MSMVQMNWRPGDRQLRQFGLIALAALPLLGWLWHAGGSTLGVLTAAGGLLALAGLAVPQSLRLPYLALCLLTLPIGIVMGELVLLVLFYGVFVPTGLVMRLLGKADMRRPFDPRATSYWQPKAQPRDVASYLRQS